MKLVYIHNNTVMSVHADIQTAKLVEGNGNPFDSFEVTFYDGEHATVGASYKPYFFDDSVNVELYQTINTEQLTMNINSKVIPASIEDTLMSLFEMLTQGG